MSAANGKCCWTNKVFLWQETWLKIVFFTCLDAMFFFFSHQPDSSRSLWKWLKTSSSAGHPCLRACWQWDINKLLLWCDCLDNFALIHQSFLIDVFATRDNCISEAGTECRSMVFPLVLFLETSRFSWHFFSLSCFLFLLLALFLSTKAAGEYRLSTWWAYHKSNGHTADRYFDHST